VSVCVCVCVCVCVFVVPNVWLMLYVAGYRTLGVSAFGCSAVGSGWVWSVVTWSPRENSVSDGDGYPLGSRRRWMSVWLSLTLSALSCDLENRFELPIKVYNRLPIKHDDV
jgi:hypothetical protein